MMMIRTSLGLRRTPCICPSLHESVRVVRRYHALLNPSGLFGPLANLCRMAKLVTCDSHRRPAWSDRLHRHLQTFHGKPCPPFTAAERAFAGVSTPITWEKL